MKFVFDFDGVLTDQTEEAHRVLELLAIEFAAESGLPLATVQAALKEGEKALAETPWLYGWEHAGRISAFSNEDLFVRSSALALWVSMSKNPILDAMRARGKVMGETKAATSIVSERAYQGMLDETRAGKIKPLEANSKKILATLLGRGHEVVIVSNSGTDRIENILQSAGVPLSNGLKIRGGAKKFFLGDRAEHFKVGPYPVDVNRPHYLQILQEEVPQAVIGDVFSLDLALPAHLARTDARFKGLNLFLRVRHYTPSWSREWCASQDRVDPSQLRMHSIMELDPLLELG